MWYVAKGGSEVFKFTCLNFKVTNEVKKNLKNLLSSATYLGNNIKCQGVDGIEIAQAKQWSEKAAQYHTDTEKVAQGHTLGNHTTEKRVMPANWNNNTK